MKKVEKELRAIVELEREQMSDDQIRLVEQLSTDMGLEFKPNSGCSKCYADQALVILKAMSAKAEKPAESDAAYALLDGVDVLFMGRRINAETITDEWAAMAVKNGFPKRLFAKMPNED